MVYFNLFSYGGCFEKRFLYYLLCSFLLVLFSEGVPVTDVQPYPDYLAAYVKTIVTAGCEQALKGGSKDVLIERATQG